MRVTGLWRGLDRLDVDGLGALVALLGVIVHLGALSERTVTVAHDRLVMHEQIGARLIRGDEAKALLVAEPLHGSCSHCCSLRNLGVRRSAEGAMKQRLRDADTCQRRDPMPRRTPPTLEHLAATFAHLGRCSKPRV